MFHMFTYYVPIIDASRYIIGFFSQLVNRISNEHLLSLLLTLPIVPIQELDLSQQKIYYD